jgi:hypothetical protein
MKNPFRLKTSLHRLIGATSLAIMAQTASADVLLTDNFMVSSNSQNVNQQLATRQTGALAPAQYTGWAGQHQVGNTSTDVGQPGGATNGNYVLLASDGSFFSDLNIASVATGPLTVQFDMYITGSNNPSTDPTTWGACTLRAAGDPFPVAGAGEFGFLQRVNGGMQVFQGGNNIAPSGWDTAGFATNTHWTLVFSDLSGTTSAFNGNGSQVTFINGTNNLGTIQLSQLNSEGLRLGFRDVGNRFAGIANLSITGTSAGLPPPGQNLSFEYDTVFPGNSIPFVPTSWTPFNQVAQGDIGSQNAGGVDYTTFDPLAAPADGTNYCYVNVFNGTSVSGIYQDLGPLQPNSIYTLTVAIGSRADRVNSPGIISLINGTDNTGTVLATGGGLPGTQNTWQDYTTTFATGGSVSGDVTVELSALGASTIQADFDNVRLNVQHFSVPLPVLVTNTLPASTTVAVGSNVVFTAAFSNSPPVTLQWQQIVSGSPNVTNLINTGVVNVNNNGVVSSTLTLNNVQVAASASYQLEAVNATNNSAVVYSAPASLTVVPPITWYTAGTYNSSFVDNTVLALAGSAANEVYGVDFGGSGLQTTANGYTFDDYASTGNMSIVPSGLGNFGSYLGSASTGDGALDLVLNNGVYGTAANTGTLNNLTVGQTYTVLVLLDDTRSTVTGGPNFYVTDGLTVSPNQQYAFVNGVPKIGGFIMGTFTARSTTQPLTVLNGGVFSQYNGILLEKGIAPPPPIPPTLATDLSPPVFRVTTGSQVNLSPVATGSLPLQYQWFNQSGPISGATNASYLFNALPGTNSYYVAVTNAYGGLVSSTGIVISAANIVTVNNFSFEGGTTGSGNIVVPLSWTPYNDHNFCAVSSTSYSVVDPLAPPADGNNFFGINEGPTDPTGGIYQDVGPLQANTTYTLTVAIGRRVDFTPASNLGSPGIISLINGTANTGTVLVSTSGIPANVDTWQDYTVNFTTGASVSGDLTVELSVAGASTYQANFDNVRLTKAPIFTLGTPKISGGNLILTGVGGTPGAGYTLVTTTNLAAPIIWTTNSTGILDGTGAFSNSIPVGTAPARFFWVHVP